MAAGIGAISFSRAAINASFPDTVTMEWPLPAFIYACPTLQRFGVNSDEGRANCYVVQFVDQSGAQNTSVPHMFRANCTSVTFELDVTDSHARVICRIDFF